MRNKIGAKGKNNIWIWIVAVVVVLMLAGVINLGEIFNKKPVEPSDAAGGGIYFAPDAAYTTVDAFGASAVTGTVYYAEKDSIFQTTAPKLTLGNDYVYWVSNGTEYFVKPKTFESTGSDNVINKEAFKAGSVTITGYDVVNNCNSNTDVTVDSCNISTAANTASKVDLKYLGGAKTSNLPFGGVMVVEYNSTVPTLECAGDGIVGLNSKYQVTYTNTATSMTHKVYEVAPGFDISKTAGTTGVTNVIRCETVNGDIAAGAGVIKVTFLSANYYIGNDGMVYLDVEKAKSGSTTRTGYTNAALTKTFYTE